MMQDLIAALATLDESELKQVLSAYDELIVHGTDDRVIVPPPSRQVGQYLDDVSSGDDESEDSFEDDFSSVQERLAWLDMQRTLLEE